MRASPVVLILTATLITLSVNPLQAQDDHKTVRVFIFAGQSNMVGSDSRVQDIKRFPPFQGLEDPQEGVMFSYCIGRENKTQSDGWVTLRPVNDIVGPELSFARRVTRNIKAPIAIIKCAAGGTHLGGDWNPDEPKGFKMYPLTLKRVRDALADLTRRKIPYRVEGFMWHQGENDMFEEGFMPAYGKNLKNFIACWRRDLNTPDLRFYIGELCTKTIWGMDLRPRMYAISVGQKEVCREDPLAQYIPTSHVGVEIGGGVGLHYHYGTLGQLEHGVNYADAYLRNIGAHPERPRPLTKWPYPRRKKVKLFILAGHRNMEGERAFVQELKAMDSHSSLAQDNQRIAYRYSVGGGYKISDGWEPLGPAGPYDTFGPELSFAQRISERVATDLAIAKFTHSGSQVIDWTPEGSVAKTRTLYPSFLSFIKNTIHSLRARGITIELEGIFYHLGENDMSFAPFRQHAAERLRSVIAQSRKDLAMPKLRWFISQQLPTNHESVNEIDVVTDIDELASADEDIFHIKVFRLPKQEKKLVLDTAGIVALGELMAEGFLKQH